MDKEKNKKRTASEKNKKNKKGRKKVRILISLLVALIVIAGTFFYAVPAVLGVNWNNMFEYYGAYISKPESDDENCLFSVIGGDIKNIEPLSGAAIVSTPNSTVVIGKNGGIISADNNGYSAAVIKSTDKKYIAFERSTGKFSVLDKKSRGYSSQLDGEIINAAVSEGGNYAIISKKTLSTSLLTVYSDKNDILFQWECNNGYLTDCAISPNGKNIAVTSFDVENGDKVTRILTFTTKSLDVEKEIDTENGIVCSMKFLNNDSLGYVTDENYFIADVNSGEKRSVSYEYDTLSGWFFAENNTVTIAKTSFGSLDESVICVLDRNADELMNCKFEGHITDFCTDKSFVYILSSDKITVLAISSGETVSEIETAGGLRNICVISGKIFCSSENEVYSYNR